MIQPERVKKLNQKDYSGGDIVYWMSREQRVRDNWALVRSRELASRFKTELKVIFCLSPSFLDAPWRHYHFLIEGLKEVESELENLNIGFTLLTGDPAQEIPEFIRKTNPGYLVTDFSPLRIKRDWEDAVRKKLAIPFECVDAHNIVPCWLASEKQEFAAYTLRPKLKRLRSGFLWDLTRIERQDRTQVSPENDWEKACRSLKIDKTVGPVSEFTPGENAAHTALDEFVEKKLSGYGENRNDPNRDSLSNMSIYLHYGHISAQRIALGVSESEHCSGEDREAYLEELIVRRELADNYCYYNRDYDNFNGFPEWARKSLDKHREDAREYIYSSEEFEKGLTHDPLWNAAQAEMTVTGKMHGFMRMYWAKKILEWSGSPEEAQEIAIYLNDKYELDGRDPNGYTGIAWSIGGVHDRAWFERDIFGKIRYMNFNGCRRKFNVNSYIDKVSAISS